MHSVQHSVQPYVLLCLIGEAVDPTRLALIAHLFEELDGKTFLPPGA